MIEGCKHGPAFLIPQPCADCERERTAPYGEMQPVAEELLRRMKAASDAEKAAGVAAGAARPRASDLESLLKTLDACPDVDHGGTWCDECLDKFIEGVRAVAASRPRPQEGAIQQALDALHDYNGPFSRSTDHPDELIVPRQLHGLLCDLWLASRKGAASPPPQEPDK